MPPIPGMGGGRASATNAGSDRFYRITQVMNPSQWLIRMQIMRDADRHILHDALPEPFARSLKALPGGRA